MGHSKLKAKSSNNLPFHKLQYKTKWRLQRLTLVISMVSMANFLSLSFLSLLVSNHPATPPPPVFDPTHANK